MKKLKKWLSICLAFVMVFGMLVSSVPAKASNNINATITGIMPHEDQGLIVLKIASDGEFLNENLNGQIKVGGTINSALYLHYNAPLSATESQYLIFAGAQETGTQVEFGGAFTTASGKTVNVPQTTLEWTGAQWKICVEPVDATITGLMPHADAGLIVLKIAGEGELLTENLNGEIKVGGTANSSLYLHYNAPLSTTESQYLIFAGAQETGTRVEFGGTFTTVSGAEVNVPQTTLEWTGTEWALVVAPINATVGAITQPTRTDNLIVIDLESDKALPTGVFTGKITVGTTEKTVDLVHNAGGGEKNYFFDPGVKDASTLVTISGVFTGTIGKINIAETTFQYTGTQWVKYVAPVDATVGAITQPSRTDNLIVIDLESDKALPTGVFTGKITVGTTEKTVDLVHNAGGGEKNYFFDPGVKDANTLVTISGVFTGTTGKINIAEETFEYTGTQWVKHVPTVDVTVGAITQPSRTDSLIVIDLESDKALPTGVFTGKITVGTTEKTVDLVHNAGGGEKNYFFDPGVKDANTLVTISGVFTGTTGKINIAEETFEYTGTQWVKYVPTVDATVGTITQPTRDDSLIVIDLLSDKELPTGTFAGKISVNETEKEVTLVHNAGGGEKNYFFDPGVKDANTLVTISGVFTGTTGKINIAEETFEYTGTQWVKYVPTVDATVGTITQPTRDDSLIVIDLLSDKELPTGTFAGKISVNGTEKEVTLVHNAGGGEKNYFFDPGVKDTNTLVTISGVFTGTNGKINIAEIAFKYTGASWVIYEETKTATFNSLYGQEIADKHIRMIVTTNDTLPINTVLTGTFYVDGEENTTLGFMKVGDYHYALFTDSITVIEGTKIKLGGVYVTADGRQVEFGEVTFIYSGTSWQVDYPTANAICTGLYGQDITDTHIRMLVTTDDTLPLYTAVTGTFYVDGEENTTLSFMKVGDYHYAVFTDSITVTEGTKIKLGGIYTSADGRKVEFAEVTFVYTGTVWQIDYKTANASCTGLYGQDIADKHIRILVETDDTLPIYAELTGTFYVDGEENTTLGFMKAGDYHYAVFTDSIAVKEGTRIRLKGVYTATDGRKVEFAETEFVYNGAVWELVYLGPIPKVDVVQVSFHENTDFNIRINVHGESIVRILSTLTGDIYVNGKVDPKLNLTKYADTYWFINVEDATIGTVVTINGIYKSAGSAVEFPSIDFVYDGASWGMQRNNGEEIEEDFVEDINNVIVRYPGVMDDDEENNQQVNTNQQEQTDNQQEDQEDTNIQENTNNTEQSDDSNTVDNTRNDNSTWKIIIIASSIGLIGVVAIVGILILNKDGKKR